VVAAAIEAGVMDRSAKVIAFRRRASCDEGAAHLLDERPDPPVKPMSTLQLWIVVLLAPLLLVGSVVLFLAVVGVWLVWLLITIFLVAGMVVFARRLRRHGLFLLGRRAVG